METLVHLLDNPWLLALCIVLGFVVLVLGADGLVAGASGLAKRFHISDLAIGMTVVAFGTSMPEFVVNVVSVVDGETTFAITNILGSNIFNVFFILGVSALIYPVASQAYSRKVDIPMSAAAALLLLLFVWIDLPSETAAGMTRWSGVILLLFFALFLWQTFRHAKTELDAHTESYRPMAPWKAILLIILGLAGLVIGARLIVTGAEHIATSYGWSPELIGLTILAVGTSLPELATSVVAAFRKNSDIAIGNVVGSNLFNIFFILGTSAACRPLPAYDGFIRDALMATMGSVLLLIILFTSKKRRVTRLGGGLLMLGYVVYVTYLILQL